MAINLNAISGRSGAIVRSRAVTFSLALLSLSTPLLQAGATDINSMNVPAGSQSRFSDSLHVGRGSNANNSITVKGAGALLQAGLGLFLGDEGGNGAISVSDGGALTVTSGNAAIGSGGGKGEVTLTGEGTTFNVSGGSILVGDSTSSGSMMIGSGAAATSTAGNIAGNNSVAISNGGSWTVTGTGADALLIHGSLKATDGGRIVTTNAIVEGAGSVVVLGAGSRLEVSNTLRVGNNGPATMEISNGGTVDVQGWFIVSTATPVVTPVTAENAAEQFSHLTVNGAGSTLNTAGDMAVWFLSTMEVTDGGKVNTSGGAGIYTPGAPYAQTYALVSGAGSEWNIAGGMEQEGTLTIADGGKVTVSLSNAGDRMLLDGSLATVNIGAPAGQAAVVPGSLVVPKIESDEGHIVFNHTATDKENYTFAPAITGSATVDAFAGSTSLTGANSYAGTTTVYDGATLRAGGSSAFSSASDYDVRAGGMLDLAGYSQQVASLNNTGTVWLNRAMSEREPRSGTPGAVLTVGNYVGNGGTMVFNTVLGNSSSASDKLVITGMASGTTNVKIANINGLGAQTIGNGILLIEMTGGSMMPGTFGLGDRVAAGAFEYSLVPGASDGTTNNMYLTSRNTSPDQGGGQGNRTPGRPSGGSGTPGPTPIDPHAPADVTSSGYRVEVPLAAAIAPIANEYGYAMLDTLHERVGDEFRVQPMAPVYSDRFVKDARGNRAVVRSAPERQADGRTPWFNGSWARVIGDRGSRDNNNFARRGADYNYTFTGLQAGLDLYGREQGDGSSDRAGLSIAYGQIKADVKDGSAGKVGSIDTDAYTLGGYWTHRDGQGWYTDAVLQSTWYSNEARSIKGQRLSPDGFGIVASLEGGYAFHLGDGMSLEPQAQLAYQHTSFDSVNDAYGRFKFDDGESLRARLGLRLTKSWNASSDISKSLPVTAWLRGNIWHEFMDNGKVTVTNPYSTVFVAPISVPSTFGGTWGEMGAGVSGQVTENMSVFGTGAYNHSLDNHGREAWDGRIGVNVKW